MTRPVGYYVHHHGAGHRARALAVAERADGRVTLIGTNLTGQTGSHAYVDLPDDRLHAAFDGDDLGGDRPAALHYAPLDHDGIRRRVAAVTQWIAEHRPALMVVDVSCEIAMLARLASVPTVFVRLNGVRNDIPHLDAFRAATAIVAPFAAALDDPETPDWVRRKTRYCPGVTHRADPDAVEPGSVLVVGGGGGSPIDGAVWARAACATPDRTWHVIGACTPIVDPPGNLERFGWVDDAAARIARTAIVVGSAGDGVVGAVLAARRPFVCLPEDRPFDEQRSKARQLVAAGAALSCNDPATADWPSLLAKVEHRDPAAQAALDDPRGADRLAAYVIALADGDRG
ncbi:glycosyl transferase [Sphingomonas sp. Leaf38]|uniref:glycosyl transferase n=1 Tax=Sphingomonas sp. Leaf38 TaxID=1736217 RepID=UPI0006FA0804|nr:glycosyl transferase [Sphingomonas sp. Leaf38]KQN33676.1 glycosyltransferase [Sphingomonas sp. Leaf38]